MRVDPPRPQSGAETAQPGGVVRGRGVPADGQPAAGLAVVRHGGRVNLAPSADVRAAVPQAVTQAVDRLPAGPVREAVARLAAVVRALGAEPVPRDIRVWSRLAGALGPGQEAGRLASLLVLLAGRPPETRRGLETILAALENRRRGRPGDPQLAGDSVDTGEEAGVSVPAGTAGRLADLVGTLADAAGRGAAGDGHGAGGHHGDALPQGALFVLPLDTGGEAVLVPVLALAAPGDGGTRWLFAETVLPRLGLVRIGLKAGAAGGGRDGGGNPAGFVRCAAGREGCLADLRRRLPWIAVQAEPGAAGGEPASFPEWVFDQVLRHAAPGVERWA